MKNASYLLTFLLLPISQWACTENYKTAEKDTINASVIKNYERRTKPGSSFADTLFVNDVAAIFFYPDSLQDAKIKAITEATVYNSSIHEMFYQMRNAKLVIKKTYPKLKIVEVTKSRYIQIRKKEGGLQIIDLNKYNDARGLIIANLIKSPQLVDMTNIETELYRYFKEIE